MKGYMTVEASFILPTVFGVILFVISLLFYSYDRCLLEQDVMALVVRSEYLEGEDLQEKRMLLEQEILNWYLDKYVWMKAVVNDLEVKEDYVQIEVSGAFSSPFFRNAEVQRKMYVLSPQFWIRRQYEIEKQLQNQEETDEDGIYQNLEL